MAPTSAITPREMAHYRATARQQETRRRQLLESRRRAAWQTAQHAAALLKHDYGVNRVVLFGSLTRQEPFSVHSDIDLAVWGLDERAYYRAVSRLLNLNPAFSIDLLRAEALSEDFVAAIEAAGIPL